jgi:hypothetical protein
MKISCKATEQRPNRPAAGWAGIEQIGQQFRKTETKMDWPDKKIKIQKAHDFHAMEIPRYPNWMKNTPYATE